MELERKQAHGFPIPLVEHFPHSPPGGRTIEGPDLVIAQPDKVQY